MIRRALIVATGAALAAAPLLFAQGSGAPAPGQAQPPKSTAVIAGQVIDGSTGQPIPEAIVTLTPPGARGRGATALPSGLPPEMMQAMQAALAAASAGRGQTAEQRVLTGGDGRFVFHGLPPGQARLAASLTGYTSSLAFTPGLSLLGGTVTQVSASPVTVPLREGEFATDVKLRLWKYAVISGTVLDDGGEPAIGLTVQAARRIMAAGRARYVPAQSGRTDDRGMFRISGLVPGDYIVAVPQAQVSMPSAIMSGIVESMTSGSGAGGAGVALMDLMSSGVMPTDAMTSGVRMGDFMVASNGSVPLLSPEGKLLTYQTSFYPGAMTPAQASLVSLKSGEDRTAVNFQLQLTPTSRLSGTAMGPEGPVANLGIRLVVPAEGGISESEFDVATAITKADGTFSFFGVPPGQFLLRAEKQPRPEIPAASMSNPAVQAMFGPGGMPAGSKDMLFGAAPVAVSTADVDGVVLQMAAGFRVRGRVEFQSETGRQPPTAQQLQAIAVLLTPADGRMPNLLAMGQPDRANAQAEFQTKGYQPGKYFLSVTGAGPWQLRAATVGGRDVFDAPIEIKDGDIGGLVATLTDRLPAISGSVTAPGETDLSETTIVMVPADYQTWIANSMNPRRARSTRAGRDGSYTIASVPAGDYLLVAIERSTEGDLQDPAYVEAIARAATPLTVGRDAAQLNLIRTKVAR